jgi:hypothetical protein
LYDGNVEIIVFSLILVSGACFLFVGHITPPPIFKPTLSQEVTEGNIFFSFIGVLGKGNCNVLLTVEEKEK